MGGPLSGRTTFLNRRDSAPAGGKSVRSRSRGKMARTAAVNRHSWAITPEPGSVLIVVRLRNFTLAEKTSHEGAFAIVAE